MLFNGIVGRDGGHKDQTSVVREVLIGCLANEELPTRVCVEDLVEVFRGDLVDTAKVLNVRVGSDNVHLLKVRFGLLE